MNAIAFDSHEAAIAYKEAGFTDAQVEALLAVDRKTTALPDISALALKSDLLALKSDLTNEIRALRTDLTSEINGVRAELTHDISGVRGELKSLESRLTGAIETAKFQMLTSVIVAMGGLTAIVLAIAKLVH